MKNHILFYHWINNKDYCAIENFIVCIFVFGVYLAYGLKEYILI